MEPSGEGVRAGQAESVSPEKPCGNPLPSLPARGFPFPFPETLTQLVPGGVHQEVGEQQCLRQRSVEGAFEQGVPLLHAGEGTGTPVRYLGNQDRQDPRAVQVRYRSRRICRQGFRQFADDTLAGNRPDPFLCLPANRLPGPPLDDVAGPLVFLPDRPQHPQGVFPDPVPRISHAPDPLAAKVFHPPEEVDHLRHHPFSRCPERNHQAVDREVAPACVLPGVNSLGADRELAGARPGGKRRARGSHADIPPRPGGRHLVYGELLPRREDPPDPQFFRGKGADDLPQRFEPDPGDHQVDVLARPPLDKIADDSPHEKGGSAGGFRGATEFRDETPEALSPAQDFPQPEGYRFRDGDRFRRDHAIGPPLANDSIVFGIPREKGWEKGTPGEGASPRFPTGQFLVNPVLVLRKIVEVHLSPCYYVELQEFVVKFSDLLSFPILILDGPQQVAEGDDLPAQLQFGRDAPGVLEDLVGDAKVLGNHRVVFEPERFSCPRKVCELPPLDRLANLLLRDLFQKQHELSLPPLVYRFVNSLMHRERRCAAPARRATEAYR